MGFRVGLRNGVKGVLVVVFWGNRGGTAFPRSQSFRSGAVVGVH